jgi:hypothetical protein
MSEKGMLVDGVAVKSANSATAGNRSEVWSLEDGTAGNGSAVMAFYNGTAGNDSAVCAGDDGTAGDRSAVCARLKATGGEYCVLMGREVEGGHGSVGAVLNVDGSVKEYVLFIDKGETVPDIETVFID